MGMSRKFRLAGLLAVVLVAVPGLAAAMGLTWGSATTSTSATSSASAADLPQSRGAFGLPLLGPHRLALAPEGWVYVVDGQGGLQVLTARGESMGSVPLPDRALAVAAAPGGMAFVSTVGGRILTVDAAAARVVASVDVGYALGPMGLAYDGSSDLLWLAERDAGQLRAIRRDGTTVLATTSGGGVSLSGAEDVAIDPVAGLAWVALDNDPRGPIALAFTLSDAIWVRSALPGGTGVGLVTRAGGIAVDGAGRVYVSDQFFGDVQVADGAGTYLGAIGGFGSGPGRLREPAGMVARPDGAILVASADGGRIEQFGGGVAAAVCEGDYDCDGLPDAWELAHGLDPRWAGDALLDSDHDGLTNLMELRLGTDPRNPDTDGDGVSDGDELLAGTNPLVDDRRPTLVTSNPREDGPGLVRWSATLQAGTGACSVAWSQVGGLAVRLRGGDGFAPSFVGRAAGEYAFQGVATCGGRASDPATVTAVIDDVAPRPDPGRIRVVRAGRSFRLDGGFSSDANGDALSLAWEQTLGRALRVSSTGALLSATAPEPGLLTFQLTAAEGPGGLRAAAEVPVLVVDSDGETPTAVVVSPVIAQVGTAVTLDASASTYREEATFRWRQIDGPAVVLAGAGGPTPSFVPPRPGRYAFELALESEGTRSPPATVEVFAAPAGGELPVAAIRPVLGAVVGEPMELDGAGSTGAGLSWRWRQLSGPAAGLRDADRAVATVVPFGPGSYVFELTVGVGDAVGVPQQVRFEANVSGGAIPKAVAVAVKGEGDAWTLDGSASTSGPAPLRYRWTQVAGTWVALDDPSSAAPSFRARIGGTYAFELEVDDGKVRSAPVLVRVSVENGRDP